LADRTPIGARPLLADLLDDYARLLRATGRSKDPARRARVLREEAARATGTAFTVDRVELGRK